MALFPFNKDVSVHQQLGDNPNTDNGLSADAIKAMFDRPAEDIKAYLNNDVVPQVNNAQTDAADAKNAAEAAQTAAAEANTTAANASAVAQEAGRTAAVAQLAARNAETSAAAASRKAPFIATYGVAKYAAIVAAVSGGKPCYCQNGSVRLPLVRSEESAFLFAGVTDAVNGVLAGCSVTSANEWSTYQTAYKKTGAINESGTDDQVPTALAVYKAMCKLEEKIGTGGNGGYYTPVVTQPDANTMQFGYAPSDAGMPAVPPVTVELPGGSNDSGQNPNFDPTVRGLPVLALTGDISEMSKNNKVTLGYKFLDRTGTLTCKWQGASSLLDPKKGYRLVFDNPFEAAEGWGEQVKYNAKAYHGDASMIRDVSAAKLWGQVVRTRTPVNEFSMGRCDGLYDRAGNLISGTAPASGVITTTRSLGTNGVSYLGGHSYAMDHAYTLSADVLVTCTDDAHHVYVGFFDAANKASIYVDVSVATGSWQHVEVAIANPYDDARAFVLMDGGSTAQSIQIKNIEIRCNEGKNLFHASEVTGFVDKSDSDMSSYCTVNTSIHRLAINRAAYNSRVYITGRTYPKGKYKISFRAKNNRTDNPFYGVQVGFGKAGVDTITEVTLSGYGAWYTFDVEVENTVEDAYFFIQPGGGKDSSFNNSMQYLFNNVIINPGPFLSELPNCGAIDGFPIIITQNGAFHGLYYFNIPKDAWMFGMGNGTQEGFVCADLKVDATRFKGLANLTSDYELEYVPDEDNADWLLTSLNRMLGAVIDSDGTDIDTTLAKYLDWSSVIDHYIFTILIGGIDNLDKNYNLVTYDGIKWFFSEYDLNATFGIYPTGARFITPADYRGISYYASLHRAMWMVRTYKWSEMKARYAELRAGVLSDANVVTTVTNLGAAIPSRVSAADWDKWPSIPSTAVNTVDQICNWYRMHAAIIDAEMESL